MSEYQRCFENIAKVVLLTVPGLAELQTCRSTVRGTNDNGVRVGGGLECGESASNDEGTDTEPSKACRGMRLARKMSSRPEHDGTDGVEREAHQDCDLVTLPFQDLSSHGRVEEVATPKVHDLKACRLELGYAQYSLEVLVEDIEETVGETPEEEEGDDK